MIHSLSYWSTQNGLVGTEPIDSAIAQVKQAGFAGIELCLSMPGDGMVLHTQSTQAECDAIRAQVDASGLVAQTVAAGLTWGCSPTSDDAATRAKSIELHAAALQRAGWLGCQAMLMVPGIVGCPFVPTEKVPYDVAIERCREAVKQLLPVAEKAGVDLCLENVWNGMFITTRDWCEFIDSFNSSRLGVYFDVGNVLGYHQHPPHWIEALGKRIKRVHIKDYKINFDWSGSFSFCDLQEGDVAWPQVVAALKKIGYDSTLVAEMMPWRADLPAKTAASMKAIFG